MPPFSDENSKFPTKWYQLLHFFHNIRLLLHIILNLGSWAEPELENYVNRIFSFPHSALKLEKKLQQKIVVLQDFWNRLLHFIGPASSGSLPNRTFFESWRALCPPKKREKNNWEKGNRQLRRGLSIVEILLLLNSLHCLKLKCQFIQKIFPPRKFIRSGSFFILLLFL